MDSDTGPQNLDQLFKALPSFVKGLATGKIGGKGRPAVKMPDPSTPSYACDVCGISFQSKADPMPGLRFCRKCHDLLNEGYTAVTCDTGDYSFIKADSLKDMAGSILKVSPPVMAMLRQKFDKTQSDEKEDADAKDNQPD